MAMIFTETWASYLATADLSRRYATVDSVCTWQATGGPLDGPCVVADNTAGAATAFLITRNTAISPPTAGPIYIGFWVKVSAAPAENTNLLSLVDVTSTLLWNLVLRTGGNLILDDGSFVRANSAGYLPDNEWHWLEIENDGEFMYMDDAVGWSTNNITNNLAYTSLRFVVPAGVVMSLGDIIVYNNSAGYPQFADFPIGPITSRTLRPMSDSVVQFDPGTQNASQVNETALDLSTFVQCQSDDAGFQDLYDYDATFPASPDPVRIHTAMLTSYLFNPDVGRVNFNHICRSGSTQETQTSDITPIELDGRYKQGSFPTDPETAAAWTAAALNAAQFGIRCDGAS